MKISAKLTHTAFFLFILNTSVPVVTIGSKYPNAEERAAKNTNKKNIPPNRFPAGRCENKFDIVTNNKLEPASGLSPSANIAGNITIPAIRAANVSNPTIIAALLEYHFPF